MWKTIKGYALGVGFLLVAGLNIALSYYKSKLASLNGKLAKAAGEAYKKADESGKAAKQKAVEVKKSALKKFDDNDFKTKMK